MVKRMFMVFFAATLIDVIAAQILAPFFGLEKVAMPLTGLVITANILVALSAHYIYTKR